MELTIQEQRLEVPTVRGHPRRRSQPEQFLLQRDAGELDQPARPLGLAESSIRELPFQRASDDRNRPRIGNAARRRA